VSTLRCGASPKCPEQALAREVAVAQGRRRGGLGFALQLLGGTMRSGREVVADLVRLDDALASAQWAITGEGRSDRQTLLSKAPFVVARHARANAVPVTLLSGALDDAALADLHRHFAGCFALPGRPMSLDECIHRRGEPAWPRARKRSRTSLCVCEIIAALIVNANLYDLFERHFPTRRNSHS
jgi:glycerate kinase